MGTIAVVSRTRGRTVSGAAVAVVIAVFTLLVAPTATAAPAGVCAAVAVFAVPGTNETSEAADLAVAVGLLKGLTDPLAERWGDALHVAYVPYPASLDRPVFYPTSELRGADRLARDAIDYAARCPAARITLIGFSQGADVVSDVVHRASRGTIGLTLTASRGR